MFAQLNHIKKIIQFQLEPSLKLGEFLNHRYKINDILGVGSYGISYFATDIIENINCVVKQSRKAKMKSSKGKLLYKKEQVILKSIEHPNIPKFLDSFENKHSIFTIMEYIPGKTYEDLIFNEGAKYDELDTFQILYKVLNVVDFIHKQGIVHRDLRIPNIIENDGEVFIIDLGLARYLSEEDEEAYEIDEKRLQREIHVRSDFYSLGHFVLFLLYSSFLPTSKVTKSWEDELEICKHSKRIIRRMLQLDHPYLNVQEIKNDLHSLFESNSKGGYRNVIF